MIAPEDVRYLWVSDYYDGPLAGLCQYRGEKLWFKIRCRPEHGPDVFDLFRLTSEQLEAQERDHELFRQHVGFHWDYGDDGCHPIGQVRDKATWHLYYDAPHPELDLTMNVVVGSYEG